MRRQRGDDGMVVLVGRFFARGVHLKRTQIKGVAGLSVKLRDRCITLVPKHDGEGLLKPVIVETAVNAHLPRRTQGSSPEWVSRYLSEMLALMTLISHLDTQLPDGQSDPQSG